MTILVDGSDSIHRRDWQREIKPALKNWIKSYPKSLVTVKQFSSEIKTELGPLIPHSSRDWEKKIDRMHQFASSTQFHRALVDVTSNEFLKQRSQVLKSLGETDNGRFKILIIVSDGWPSHEETLDPPSLEVYDLVVIVGVGSDLQDFYLDRINNASNRKVMLELAEVKDYGELRARLPELKQAVEVRLRSLMAIRSRSKRRTDILNRQIRQFPNSSSRCIDGLCNCRCYVPVMNVSSTAVAGPDGRDGRIGEIGPQGFAGADGLDGPRGNRGERGEKGPTGDDGPDGDEGQQGRQGPRGPTGEQGPQGPEGPPGPAGQVEALVGDQGPVGAAGADGLDGVDGDDGEQGDPGPRGPQGKKGPQGRNGADGVDGVGENGYYGDCGPPGQPGEIVRTSISVNFQPFQAETPSRTTFRARPVVMV